MPVTSSNADIYPEYVIRYTPEENGWHWYVGEANGFCYTLKEAVMQTLAVIDEDRLRLYLEWSRRDEV